MTGPTASSIEEAVDRAAGRNPMARKIIALADRLEGYESSALVGPVWIAHELRKIVGETP